MQLKVDLITTKAFEPFGQLIEAPDNLEPAFSSASFNYWKQLAILDEKNVEVGVLQVNRHPILFDKMERHARTKELLVPLSSDFVIAVAKPSATMPEVSTAKAFLVKTGQAVLLHKNCWHAIPCPVEKQGSMLILFRDNTSADDLILEALGEECIVIY